MQFLYFLAIVIGPLVKVLYNLIGNYAVTMIVATLIKAEAGSSLSLRPTWST